jgi:hypothetical protein
MVNGAGYNPHPYDCDKFVHCHYDSQGILHGVVQQCAFSTYWDNDLLTCIPAEAVQCEPEMCMNQPQFTRFGGVGNCRGYWECRGRKAKAMCCPRGQNWNETLGCVDNIDEDECTDMCWNEQAPVEEEDVVCDKRAVLDPTMFEQYVPGLFWVPMHCAGGTVFVEKACKCDMIVEAKVQKPFACKKELYLPFDENHYDQSGKGHYVANENVEIADGVAKFNGVSSRLIVPRFTNLEHSTTVIIRVNYTSGNMTAQGEHAIVSNGDCGNVPSILLTEDANNTIYGVGTSSQHGHLISLAVPQLPSIETTAGKVLEYRFDDGYLSGSNGVDSRIVQAPGYLRNVQCGLHIGDAENRLWFNGEISELTVYLCNPDN